MKLDDEMVELQGIGRDARPARYVTRLREAGPEGLEILVIGAPALGEAPREDVEGERDWWADLRRAGSSCSFFAYACAGDVKPR